MKITAHITHHVLSAFLLLISSCSSGQVKDNNTGTAAAFSPGKILIVYLSRTNNTKAIAEIIQKNVGGTLVALELEKPYPKNYQVTVQQVVRENETGYLPPLKTNIEDIQNYDVVFLGFPTWGMKLPPPMKTFLNKYDLKGKTVIPFNTNGGYGVGSSFQTVRDMCRNSKVLEGFTIRGGSERDGKHLAIQGEQAKVAERKVSTWLKQIRIAK